MTRACTRRDLLKAAAVGIGGLAAGGAPLLAAQTRPASRPNVLFLMTDQQTRRAMSAAGNRHLRTPHMDSIAAGGVRFVNSYCTSPVCGPSRSSLVTGRMPHQTGVNVNGQSIDRSIPNMGMVFRAAGYETAWVGKWHLPGNYAPSRPNEIRGFRYLPAVVGAGSRTDAGVADEAVKFLRQKRDRPFLLGVSLHNPHDICGWVGRRPVEHPDAETFPPLPANFEVAPDEPEFIQSCRLRKRYGPEITHTRSWSPGQWRAYLDAYYRFAEKADHEVGRVLKALRDQGLDGDTLIVFTSDHGEGTAAHRWVVKLMLYEEPATVPLVIRWRGVTPAGVADTAHLASGADVLPTLCDYAGVRAPEGMVGVSLRPVIQDPKLPGRQFLVAELQPFPDQPRRRGRMLRTARHKYVAFADGARPEMLFDLQADPGETRNLARDPAMRDELARHRRVLARWIEQTKDEFAVPGASGA